MTKRSLTILAVGGAVTLAGLVALSGTTLAQRTFGGHAFGMMGGLAGELLRDVDTDGNGRLTQQEIDASINGRYARFDADKNGTLSLEEFTSLWAELTRPLAVRAFQLLDPNGDASIARAEVDERFGRVVQRFDRNGDGALSREDRPRWSGTGERDRDRN